MTHTAYSKQKAVSIFSLNSLRMLGWRLGFWKMRQSYETPFKTAIFFPRLSSSNKEVKVQTWRRMKRRRHTGRRAERKKGHGGKRRGKRAEIEPPCVWCYTWTISRLPLSWSHLTYLWPQQIWRLAAEHQRYVNQMTCLLNYPMK